MAAAKSTGGRCGKKNSRRKPLGITSSSAARTRHVGALIGRLVKPPLVIALTGPVGAGKTTLVKGIAAGMGIAPEDVQSPSFVLLREYQGPRAWLFHADCYRLAQNQSLVLLGLEEYIHPRGILVIEWPRAIDQITTEYLDVRLRVVSRSVRTIRLRAHGSRAAAICESLARNRSFRSYVSAEH